MLISLVMTMMMMKMLINRLLPEQEILECSRTFDLCHDAACVVLIAVDF